MTTHVYPMSLLGYVRGPSQRKVSLNETTPTSGHMTLDQLAAVLSETIDKYKQVFLNAKVQAHQLEQALSKFFGSPQSVPVEAEGECHNTVACSLMGGDL